MPESNICVVCGQTARTYCSGCSKAKYLEPSQKPLFYCGKDCQQIDWQKHRTVCKTRRKEIDHNALIRVVALMQSSFLLFRRVVFDSPIASIEIVGDRLIVREGRYNITEVFYDFPDKIVEQLKKEHPNIEAMVLCLMACTDAQVFAEDLLKVFLEGTGLAREIREIGGRLKPGAMKWTVHRDRQVLECEDYYAHAFHRIVLKDGSTWAFDLAGPQFGQMSALIPWTEYTAIHTQTISTVNALGFCYAKSQEVMPLPTAGPVWTGNVGQMLAVRSYATDEVGKQIVQGILAGMAEENIAASELLTNTSVDDFERICNAMKTRGREYGEALKADWAAQGGLIQTKRPSQSSRISR